MTSNLESIDINALFNMIINAATLNMAIIYILPTKMYEEPFL